MKKVIVFNFLILLSCQILAQSSDAEFVLKQGIIGKKKEFDYSKINNGYAYFIYATYIGKIKQQNGRILKFANVYSKWGPNEHGSAWLYVYNANNKYIGYYLLGDKWDLPTTIKNRKLFFIKQNSDCNQTTEIDFYAKLPKLIFIKCKDNMGDLYKFSVDD
jgi:hypothetical protein